MQVKDKVIVVTGGASGIGKSLCERFAKEGAKAVVVSDIDQAGIDATVADISASTQALGVRTNVADENEVNDLVAQALEKFGQIDLFCSNAGIFTAGGENVSTDAWQSIWDINVMSHVFAARAVLPAMLERGEGYFSEYVVGGGSIESGGFGAVLGDKTCCHRFRRVAIDYLWQAWHQGLGAMSSGRAYSDDGRGRRWRGRSRRHVGAR